MDGLLQKPEGRQLGGSCPLTRARGVAADGGQRVAEEGADTLLCGRGGEAAHVHAARVAGGLLRGGHGGCRGKGGRAVRRAGAGRGEEGEQRNGKEAHMHWGRGGSVKTGGDV